MIYIKHGGLYDRNSFKKCIHFLIHQISSFGFYRSIIAKHYESIWPSEASLEIPLERLVVMPPFEVRQKCDKIAQRKRKCREIEPDIETTILKWCAQHNVTPRYAVYTHRPAVLFFDNDSALIMARLALDEFCCDFEENYWGAF